MFKQATVNAASIPATQTNFPVYVDLSRVGITTLAQAQSSRWYEDSAKLVEMPREVVSATEGHGKYSSLTSTSQLFIDFDGIRADYGVGDTYGRNAVWSDYESVLHLSELSGDAIDSSGNGDFTVVSADVNIDVAIGKGYSVQVNKYLTRANLGFLADNTVDITVQGWTKVPTGATLGGFPGFITLGTGGSSLWNFYLGADSSKNLCVYTRRGATSVFTSSGQNAVTNTLDMLHGTRSYTDGTQKVYRNGSQLVSGSIGGTNSPAGINPDIVIGYWRSVSDQWQGDIDEVRIISSALSASWITTEYNNQSDEATFWGTWTDVPGAGGTEYTLTCEAGTLVLDAAQSALSIGRTITAEAGTLTLAAQPATLALSWNLALETGTLELSGETASPAWSTSLVADPGNLSLDAQNAALRLSYSIDAQTLDLAINGAPAAISVALTQPLEPGSLLLSGEPVDFAVASIINPFCPMPNPFSNSASPFSQMESPFTDFPKGEC